MEKRIKILFFIFDLGHGGAEKVLVQLVNALDPERYDITVQTIFNTGVNKDSFNHNIKRKWLFSRQFHGMSYLVRLFSPSFLHKMLVKERYDYEIAYLEGVPTRVISGCRDSNTKTFAWVHIQMENLKGFFYSYNTIREAYNCYSRFNKIAFVSEVARSSFFQQTGWDDLNSGVVHNTLDISNIVREAKEDIPFTLDHTLINLCSVGRLARQKGYVRLMNVLGDILELGQSNWHFYLLGEGLQREEIEKAIDNRGLKDHVTLLGYDSNPYKYVAKMDYFVCSSYKEGYSTAVTESVLVGTPVVTTDCAGMKEILGDDAGIIVDNDDKALKEALLTILSSPSLTADMREKTIARSEMFSTLKTLNEFEDFIFS